jgi:hypothetical protein
MGAHARSSAAKAALVQTWEASQRECRQTESRKKMSGDTVLKQKKRPGISPGGGAKAPTGQRESRASRDDKERAERAARVAAEFAKEQAAYACILRSYLLSVAKARTPPAVSSKPRAASKPLAASKPAPAAASKNSAVNGGAGPPLSITLLFGEFSVVVSVVVVIPLPVHGCALPTAEQRRASAAFEVRARVTRRRCRRALL